MKGGKLPCRL